MTPAPLFMVSHRSYFRSLSRSIYSLYFGPDIIYKLRGNANSLLKLNVHAYPTTGILLLDKYSTEMHTYEHKTCMGMVRAVLFLIAPN